MHMHHFASVWSSVCDWTKIQTGQKVTGPKFRQQIKINTSHPSVCGYFYMWLTISNTVLNQDSKQRQVGSLQRQVAFFLFLVGVTVYYRFQGKLKWKVDIRRCASTTQSLYFLEEKYFQAYSGFFFRMATQNILIFILISMYKLFCILGTTLA